MQKLQNGKISDNIQHMILSLPAVVYLFIFAYLPMYGLVIAFKRFKVNMGIMKSPWVGFENFRFFFTSQDAWRVTRNTLFLNALFIVVGIICSVIFALLMFEITKRVLIKTYQTIAILPVFLSWVVVASIVYIILEPNMGVLNQILEAINIKTVQWYSDPTKWPAILTIISIWKGIGLNSIIYYASLMGMNNEYCEAAEIDGANKLQRAWYLSIPSLIPIITIMTILAIGNIFRADFGLFYNVTRDVGALYPSTDVIDTYVFRALTKNGNIGMSAAVGLFQSIVGFVLVLLTNFIVKKIEPDYTLF